MFVENGVKFLKEYFTKTNQTECYLYYNIKKDKFEIFAGKNNKKKEWQINLGIWSMFFDITVFENFQMPRFFDQATFAGKLAP